MRMKVDRRVSGEINPARPISSYENDSPPRIHWERKKSATRKKSANKDEIEVTHISGEEKSLAEEKMIEDTVEVHLSERRKALFEPLEPTFNSNGKRSSAESLLPPPDFDSVIYPRGWLVGKKRKLVNVDVVESMRRVAIQEMNRKDREIDGLSEQLEDDARVLEHIQLQLLQEKSKRSEVERENTLLKEQITMLMNILEENEAMFDNDLEVEYDNQP